MVRLNQVRSSKRLGLGASSGHDNGVGCKRQRARNTISAIAFITHIRRSPNRGMPRGAAVPGKPSSLLPEANMPSRQRLLVPPSDCAASTDRMQRILDDVQYLCESITSTAAKSLKELLRSHGVDSQLANALAAVRTAAQLHAAVRQITSRVATGLKQQLLAPLEEWVGMCMKLAPSGLSASDQNSFLEEARTVLKGAEPETAWFEVAFEMPVDKTLLVDKEALQEVDSLQSMRKAIRTMVVSTSHKADLRSLMVSLKSALGAKSSTEGVEESFDWFVHSPQKGMGSSGKATTSAMSPAVRATVTQQQPIPGNGMNAPTMDEIFEATPHVPVHDPVLVRLCNLQSDTSEERYTVAIKKIFGVQCEIRTDQIKRGFYHLIVPRDVVQGLFGTEQAMTFTGANGFTIRARTHDAQGQPYQIMGKRDRGNVRTTTSGSDGGPTPKKHQVQQAQVATPPPQNHQSYHHQPVDCYNPPSQYPWAPPQPNPWAPYEQYWGPLTLSQWAPPVPGHITGSPTTVASSDAHTNPLLTLPYNAQGMPTVAAPEASPQANSSEDWV